MTAPRDLPGPGDVSPQDPPELICEVCPMWDGEKCEEGLTPEYCKQVEYEREQEAKAWQESMRTGGLE